MCWLVCLISTYCCSSSVVQDFVVIYWCFDVFFTFANLVTSPFFRFFRPSCSGFGEFLVCDEESVLPAVRRASSIGPSPPRGPPESQVHQRQRSHRLLHAVQQEGHRGEIHSTLATVLQVLEKPETDTRHRNLRCGHFQLTTSFLLFQQITNHSPGNRCQPSQTCLFCVPPLLPTMSECSGTEDTNCRSFGG